MNISFPKHGITISYRNAIPLSIVAGSEMFIYRYGLAWDEVSLPAGNH